MDHVISMKSSFHSAHVLILILENIVKLKKSSLILAMDINEVQLESALQMARHTPVTAVTAVTLVTCVTFLHVIIIANVKIISLETFVKKWTPFHMHTKPPTVLPDHSSSFLLLMCLVHSDLQTISSGTFMHVQDQIITMSKIFISAGPLPLIFLFENFYCTNRFRATFE